MTRLLIMAAGIGLTLSTAGACEFNRSAKADIDRTVVASVDESSTVSSTQQTIILDEPAAKQVEETAQ